MAKKNNKGGSSLQDQLRKVGLVSEKQLRKAKKGLHRKDVRGQQGEVDEEKLTAQKIIKDKAEADKVKNQQRDQKAQEKAIDAQVKQLIASNSQRQKGDNSYKFSDQGKIKSIYISSENKNHLNKGLLAVVKTDTGYDLVPEVVAQKIKQRRAEIVLYLYDRADEVVDEDDPYKDFQIPDDLEW